MFRDQQATDLSEISARDAEGTSLAVQWLGICLPMQGAQVQSLIQEDPICCGATKPILRKY